MDPERSKLSIGHSLHNRSIKSVLQNPGIKGYNLAQDYLVSSLAYQAAIIWSASDYASGSQQMAGIPHSHGPSAVCF